MFILELENWKKSSTSVWGRLQPEWTSPRRQDLGLSYEQNEASSFSTEQHRLKDLSLCSIFHLWHSLTAVPMHCHRESQSILLAAGTGGLWENHSSTLKLAYLYLHMYTTFISKNTCKLNDSWRMHTICQELWLQATAFARWACIMFTRHTALHALDIISRFKTSQIKIKL